MKKILLISILVLSLLIIVGCNNNDKTESTNKSEVTKPIEVEKEEVKVTVISKTQIPADVDNFEFDDSVKLDFSIINQTEKNIIGVQGILTIKDLFDKPIEQFNCNFVENTLIPNQTFNETLYLEVNPFIEDDVEIYETAHEKLKYEYTITQVVYEGEV